MYFKNYYGACIFSDDDILLVRDNIDPEKVSEEKKKEMFERAKKADAFIREWIALAGGTCRPIEIRKKGYWQYYKITPKNKHWNGVTSVGMWSCHGDSWYCSDWKCLSREICDVEYAMEKILKETKKPLAEYNFNYWA